MPQVTKRTVARWLLAHGFSEVLGKHGGQRRFKRPNSKGVTLSGHGSPDMQTGQFSELLRALAAMGFDRENTRAELESGRWD